MRGHIDALDVSLIKLFVKNENFLLIRIVFHK